MQRKERIKMFREVFAPQPGEKVLFLVDVPHDNIKNLDIWKDRREIVSNINVAIYNEVYSVFNFRSSRYVIIVEVSWENILYGFKVISLKEVLVS